MSTIYASPVPAHVIYIKLWYLSNPDFCGVLPILFVAGAAAPVFLEPIMLPILWLPIGLFALLMLLFHDD